MSDKRNKKMTIRIYYDGRINQVLDNKIRSAMKRLGFRFYASSYNFCENERDLAFDSEKDLKGIDT